MAIRGDYCGFYILNELYDLKSVSWFNWLDLSASV